MEADSTLRTLTSKILYVILGDLMGWERAYNNSLAGCLSLGMKREKIILTINIPVYSLN